jgi:hypothetical protein
MIPMKFLTQYHTPKKSFQPHSDEVHTVPDMAPSIQTILEKHARGIPLAVNQPQSEYFEDEIIPTIKDITDIDYYRQQLQRRENELKMKINEERQKKTTAAEKKEPPTTDPPQKQEPQ